MSFNQLKDNINYDNTENNIFKLYEKNDYIYILYSKNDEFIDNDNIINLKIIDLDTKEEYETEIIDYEIDNLKNIHLNLFIIDNFIYFFYQDTEKFFTLKYSLEIDNINIYDLNNNNDELYLLDFVPDIKFDIIQDRNSIFFYYILEEENVNNVFIYKLTNNDYYLYCKIEIENVSQFILKKNNNLVLIDTELKNHYLVENDKYVKNENINLDIIKCHNKTVENYNYLNKEKYCIEYFDNNFYFLDSNISLYKNSEKIIEFEDTNITVYQYLIYDNYLLIVYSNEELDDIYNLKNIKLVNLNNLLEYNYQFKFECVFKKEDYLVLINYRKYENNNSLIIKYLNIDNQEIEKEDILDLLDYQNFSYCPNYDSNFYFIMNNNIGRSIGDDYGLYYYNLKTYNSEEYTYNPIYISRASQSLSDSTETELSGSEYKFGDYDKTTDLKIGIGTFLFTNITKDKPISFNITNLDNIEFMGLQNNICMIGETYNNTTYPYTYRDTNNNIFYFYYGTIALKVTGNFGSIPGYYIKNGNTITSISHKIMYDNSNTNGSSIENILELNELNTNRLNYNFFNLGNKGNGVGVTGYNTVNTLMYPYIHAYSNISESTCMYIRSNSIPNYIPFFNSNTEIKGLWDDFGSTYNVYEYGINKQSFGYINSGRKVLGYSYKIPTNPELVNEKNLPTDLYSGDTPNKEIFWYNGDTNWKSIMTDRIYENINLGSTYNNTLTPLGPIGVMVNGVPCYNHFEMTDTITDSSISDITKITDPSTERKITLITNTNARTDQVVLNNYDNHGGTIDKNNDYHYNKYPVSLEAMIKLGTVRNTLKNPYYGLVFTDSNIIKLSITGKIGTGIYYLNVSEENFDGFIFSIITAVDNAASASTVTALNNALEINGVPGKSINAHIVLRIDSIPDGDLSKAIRLKAIKSTTTIFTDIRLTDVNKTGIGLHIYLKKTSDTTITGYNTPQLNSNFTYSGMLLNITTNDNTKNEIKLFIEALLNSFNDTTIDSNNEFGHSPILGWSFDGYPIYGKIGYTSDSDTTLKLLKSSYTDYKYVKDSGELDICNGIFRRTPEFPNGIYHYVCTLETLTDTTIDVTNSTGETSSKSLYAYPYIIGAYRGVPDLTNFALVSTISTTTSTSANSSDTNSYSSTTSGTQSQLIVSETTNYDVRFRTIKSIDDTYNNTSVESLNISQDENYINLQQGPKPYIWNFSGNNNIQDTYFGYTNNNYGDNLSELANSGTSPSSLKAYGNVSKFKYTGTVTIGKVAVFDGDLTVKDMDAAKPILGIIIGKDTTNKFCYICTMGLCEVETITGSPSVNDILSTSTSGVIEKYTVSDIGETTVNYLLGVYVGRNSTANHLINITPHTVLG